MKINPILLATGLFASVSTYAAVEGQPQKLPEAPKLSAQTNAVPVAQNYLFEFRKLAKYQEPEWITKKVKAGELPPISERLPEEPLVYNINAMPDGAGHYGGVIRHVVGGRPQGWNWGAGQHQGWGGTSYAVAECLTRTGPLFTVKKEEQTPLPNLARSWEWSEDGKSLTMHLIKGAKWSDGDGFDADDVMFLWQDNILDKNVPAWASPSTFGEDTILTKVDKNTVRWNFAQAFPTQNLFTMGFFTFCPGPSHLLKPQHPKYNPDATYDSYNKAFGPDELPGVTMGAWVPALHKSDEIIVLRRNPYFWKVDSKGQQLPYIDEMQVKLSTWSDRTVQTVAGNADMSNMENPANFVESLRQSAKPAAPAMLEFGPRTLGWSVMFNYSENFGAKDDRSKAIRKLNRNLNFRQAISHAIDRKALGQLLVRGPFAHEYAGGIFPESSMVDESSVSYYGYKPELSKEILASLGFKDTDGDGIVNWTTGTQKGKNLQIVLSYLTEIPTDVTLANGLSTMMREIGIDLVQSAVQSRSAHSSLLSTGDFDFIIDRNEKEYITPIQLADALAPVHYNQPKWHKGTSDKPQTLLPFEQQLVEIITEFRTESDPTKQAALMQRYNKIFTDNVYSAGLVAIPGAIIHSKRIKNMPYGLPIIAYQWAEGASMRERLWVEPSEQLPQLMPNRLK